MSELAALDHLRVCRTCPRYERRAPGVPSAGLLLAARLKQLAREDGLQVLVVNCLSGCPSPCNVLLDGPGKPCLRISGCRHEDAEALWPLARRYRRAGDLTAADLAGIPGARITARVPPPEAGG
jgi:predicted metal-binding protein